MELVKLNPVPKNKPIIGMLLTSTLVELTELRAIEPVYHHCRPKKVPDQVCTGLWSRGPLTVLNDN